MTAEASPSSVDRLYADFSDLLRFLDTNQEPSFRSVAEDSFRKGLLLASASYFETAVCNAIEEFVRACSADSEPVIALVRKKALSRQYHTLFNWDSSNANVLFGLFGETFEKSAKLEIASDVTLAAAVAAFMEIGRDRNRLVHQNYVEYSLEKTTDDIHDLFKKASVFVDWLRSKFAKTAVVVSSPLPDGEE
jgi:hypothetical protein